MNPDALARQLGYFLMAQFQTLETLERSNAELRQKVEENQGDEELKRRIEVLVKQVQEGEAEIARLKAKPTPEQAEQVAALLRPQRRGGAEKA